MRLVHLVEEGTGTNASATTAVPTHGRQRSARRTRERGTRSPIRSTASAARPRR
jgi:hypothetical protein